MSQNKEKKYGLAIGGFYFFYFAAHVCVINYLNVYLEKYLGFSGSQLGLFNGITVFLSVFLIPIWGILSDKTQKYKFMLCSFLACTFLFGILLSLQKAFLWAIVFGLLLELSRCGVLSMGDTQSMDYAALSNGNYGRFRSMGSIGWVISGVVLGLVATRIGLNKALFPFYLVYIFIAFLMASFFPKHTPRSQGKGMKKGDISLLLKNKAYLFVLLITVLTGVVADGINGFVGNHLITTLGAKESIISLNTACCAIPEFFYLGIVNSKVLPKLGFRKVYLYSACLLAARFLLYSLAGNPYVFVLGSLLHFATVGCTTVTNLAYIRRVVPSSVFGTAVTFMYSSIMLGKSLYSYIYGWLYDTFGSVYIFRFTFLVVLVAAVLIYRSKCLSVPYSLDPQKEEN